MAKKMTKKEKQQMKDKLVRCRRAYAERGAKLIVVTHHDGKKSAIANPKAVKAALDAIKVELDRQIAELGGDPERSGLNEVVRDWMLREHPEERKFMDDFSETVTFLELVRRMKDGENFYEILVCGESQQREYCFAHLSDVTGTKYSLWYNLWLDSGDYGEDESMRRKRERRLKRVVRNVEEVLRKIEARKIV